MHQESPTDPATGRTSPIWNSGRTLVALSCAALLLASCGGSDSEPTVPVPTLSTPTEFGISSSTNIVQSANWTSVAGATRYELFVDPDGAGPGPEVQVDPANIVSDNATSGTQWASTPSVGGVNATYRLRACNADGCSAFTPPFTPDLTAELLHQFPSGATAPYPVPGQSQRTFRSIALNGLTFAHFSGESVKVYAKSSRSDPWREQATLPAEGGVDAVVSGDGDTLVLAGEHSLRVYRRAGEQWPLESTLEATLYPPNCWNGCNRVALSDNGDSLAVFAQSGVAPATQRTVLTYQRTGSTWSVQNALTADSHTFGRNLTLSGDGRTLAVSIDEWDRSFSSGRPSFVQLYQKSDDGAWEATAKIPTSIVYVSDISGSIGSAIQLSANGNALAILSQRLQGLPPEHTAVDADLTCGSHSNWDIPAVGSYRTAAGWYIGVFERSSSSWKRSAVITRGYNPSWALATDGNQLFYANETFTRKPDGSWACP